MISLNNLTIYNVHTVYPPLLWTLAASYIVVMYHSEFYNMMISYMSPMKLSFYCGMCDIQNFNEFLELLEQFIIDFIGNTLGRGCTNR